MDSYAYCTALTYNVESLFNNLRSQYKASMTRGVVHLEVPCGDIVGDAFFFPHGTMVAWGLPHEAIAMLLGECKPFEDSPLDKVEFEEYTYEYGKEAAFKDDAMVLPDREAITKLAFSHALAQSAKLCSFEIMIQGTFEKTKHLPESLSKFGKIPLSRKEIRRKIGELFIERSSINLHVDVLDTPEFFWEYPEFETIYHHIANDLDIETRTSALNQQLDVIHDLFEMLGNELNHQHSSRLEWAIIWLIIIEVTLLIFHDILKII